MCHIPISLRRNTLLQIKLNHLLGLGWPTVSVEFPQVARNQEIGFPGSKEYTSEDTTRKEFRSLFLFYFSTDCPLLFYCYSMHLSRRYTKYPSQDSVERTNAEHNDNATTKGSSNRGLTFRFNFNNEKESA